MRRVLGILVGVLSFNGVPNHAVAYQLSVVGTARDLLLLITTNTEPGLTSRVSKQTEVTSSSSAAEAVVFVARFPKYENN